MRSFIREGRRSAITMLLSLVLVLAVGCSDDGEATSGGGSDTAGGGETPASIADLAKQTSGLSTLAQALEVAGLAETLASGGPFTVFAPTDDAFAALPAGTLDGLLADPDALSQVLLYHVTEGSRGADDLSGRTSIESLTGEMIAIEKLDDGSLRIGNARVTTADVAASNGTIHIIDAVLLPAEEPEPELKTIVEIAAGNEDFETLVAALTAADLVGALSGEGPFTVFAPTDDAFAALPEGTVEALLNDIPALTDILLYHVVPGDNRAADVVAMSTLTTLQGETVAITVDMDGNAFVNGARIVMTDIVASNGVIHVIDAVITPPAEPELKTIAEIAVGNEDFETLVAALTAADLVGVLSGEGPFTVFAPTDDAFAALPEGTVEALLNDIPALTDILLYHVVSGDNRAADVVSMSTLTTLQGETVAITVDMDGNAFVNDAQIVMTDIVASNGVIHVIDAVITPPVEPELKTIAEIAVGNEDFETLVAALTATDLVGALSGEGPFTVFAPTDDAFAALPEGTVEALLNDIPALTDILLYHVVPGDNRAADVVAMSTLTTLQGKDVAITVDMDGNAFVNDAQIVMTDIVASNGVIHVIDAVITPPVEPELKTIAEIAVGNEDFETLVAALTAADLVGALSGEGPFTVFAPTDDAFAALPEGTVEALLNDIPALTDILLYHVVPGDNRAADVVAMSTLTTLQGKDVAITVDMDGNAFVNDAQIVMTDIVASNGVIHVIDAVITPPVEPELKTIAEIAVGNEDFETLVAALTAADLVGALSGEGPFTVFAPTDDAFAALPEGTVEALLNDIPALTDILLYHVVPGDNRAADVVAMSTLTTLQGETVAITVDMDGNAFVNGARIVMTDIVASNGVIHVIDAVITPPVE